MHFYLAPMEGLTGYIYRNIFDEFYSGIEKYFTPFIVPATKRNMRTRELNDIIPEHNQNKKVIPQILTRKSEDFIRLANELKQIGYTEVNLNLGCPSGTVVARGKGSGFLAYQNELDEFLYDIFEKLDMNISIKTRIGKDNPDEFYELLDIYNKYKLQELIIHPRIQSEYYKGEPHYEIFEYAYKNSRNKLCYNGDIFDLDTFNSIRNRFPEINTVMIGRGLIANPQLIDQIVNGEEIDYEKLRNFHDRLIEKYKESMSGDMSVLNKMKEIWFYMIRLFPGNDKNLKKIRKVQHIREYNGIVDEIFRSAN